MDLVQKFEWVTWDKSFSVIDLERNCKYPIIKAKRITTKIGPDMVLTIRDSQDDTVLVFLPRG